MLAVPPVPVHVVPLVFVGCPACELFVLVIVGCPFCELFVFVLVGCPACELPVVHDVGGVAAHVFGDEPPLVQPPVVPLVVFSSTTLYPDEAVSFSILYVFPHCVTFVEVCVNAAKRLPVVVLPKFCLRHSSHVSSASSFLVASFPACVRAV